ncbi:MAG: hypothetical protein IE931_12705 [Sphingobacteriales bacterium]|nr:hypothetical protein [Sphingobacteriales bacterium]
MIEISTPTSNSISDNDVETEQLNLALTAEEIAFFENLKPKFDSLKKNPSEKTIQNILNFSKTL